MKRLLFISVFVFASLLNAQQGGMIQVIGDSLIGKTVNGEAIREVHGNVVMTQDAVRITCQKAIQYLARNEAELIGKVVVLQDSITIKTDIGFYNGNTKTAFSKAGVEFFDGHVNLRSKNGYYYFDEKKAFFYESVTLYDSVSTLWSDSLTFFDEEDKAIAVGNVKVRDTASVLLADSLIHLRGEKKTYAYRNVRVIDPEEKFLITGEALFDDGAAGYSRMSGSPILAKIDTTEAGKTDTLFISSELLESFSDSTRRLVASGAVKMVRGGFASINNFTIYFRAEDKLYTHRREEDKIPPVLWNEDSQLMGDTIYIFVKENRLNRIDLIRNASIISGSDKYPERYDQLSGKRIKLFFEDGKLSLTEVTGNALSIYYMYEEEEPNGLLKSSAENSKIIFKENSVAEVKFYGNPVSEYHPQNVVEGKERDFSIPTFLIVSGRPAKETLLKEKEAKINSYIKEMETYGK